MVKNFNCLKKQNLSGYEIWVIINICIFYIIEIFEEGFKDIKLKFPQKKQQISKIFTKKSNVFENFAQKTNIFEKCPQKAKIQKFFYMNNTIFKFFYKNSKF